MEETLISTGVEVMLLEMVEYLVNMPFVLFFGVRVDEDVIQVYHHAYIEQVNKDVIHEVLESSRHICESEGHDMPFKGAIAGAESGLPFIAHTDVDHMVCVAEVDFQIRFLPFMGCQGGQRCGVGDSGPSL